MRPSCDVRPILALTEMVMRFERDYRREGRSLATEYMAEVRRYEAELPFTRPGGYRDYLADQIRRCRSIAGLLVGLRGARAYLGRA